MPHMGGNLTMTMLAESLLQSSPPKFIKKVINKVNNNKNNKTGMNIFAENSPLNIQKLSNTRSKFYEHMNWNLLSPQKSLFSVGTFNILSPSHIVPKYYPNCNNNVLKWNNRKYQIANAISHADLDIVCLQECQFYGEFVKEAMSIKGYESVFARRPTRPDGTSVIWKREKFECVDYKTVDLNILAENSDVQFRQNCVGLVVILQEKSSKKLICVTTTHIYWKTTHTDVKIKQVQHMLEEAKVFVEKFNNNKNNIKNNENNNENINNINNIDNSNNENSSESKNTNNNVNINNNNNDNINNNTNNNTNNNNNTNSNNTNNNNFNNNSIPILFCGDLNVSPKSGIYKYIISNNKNFDFSIFDKDVAGHRCDGDKYGHVKSTIVTHPLPGLKSAYGNYNNNNEPDHTTYTAKIHKGTLDYVFFQPSLLRLTSLLSLPDEKIMQSLGGVPNVEWGSDHLLLGCQFSMD